MFNIVCTFLQSGANALIYWGSVTNTDFITEPTKYGRPSIDLEFKTELL